jgi:hypothetical protein
MIRQRDHGDAQPGKLLVGIHRVALAAGHYGRSERSLRIVTMHSYADQLALCSGASKLPGPPQREDHCSRARPPSRRGC